MARALRKVTPPQEARVWTRLRKLRPQGHHFRRQVPIGAYVVDFACLKRRLIVEIDGSQHGMDEHRLRDQRRDDALAALDYRVLRFWNSAVREDIDGVMDTILARLNDAP